MGSRWCSRGRWPGGGVGAEDDGDALGEVLGLEAADAVGHGGAAMASAECHCPHRADRAARGGGGVVEFDDNTGGPWAAVELACAAPADLPVTTLSPIAFAAEARMPFVTISRELAEIAFARCSEVRYLAP